jgi:DNA-binding response OmpR family regulator
VFAAETVKEAEQFLLTNTPIVIVLDIMMPEINGIEACQRFRKALGDRIPILFLTAADTMEVVLMAMKAGGDDYIVKSGSPSTLIERIKHWRTTTHADLPERRLKAVAYLESRVKPGLQAKPARPAANSELSPIAASAKR